MNRRPPRPASNDSPPRATRESSRDVSRGSSMRAPSSLRAHVIGGDKPNEAWHHLQDDNATVVSADSVTGRNSEISGTIDTTGEDPMRISHMDLINDFSGDTGGRFYDQVCEFVNEMFRRTSRPTPHASLVLFAATSRRQAIRRLKRTIVNPAFFPIIQNWLVLFLVCCTVAYGSLVLQNRAGASPPTTACRVPWRTLAAAREGQQRQRRRTARR